MTITRVTPRLKKSEYLYLRPKNCSLNPPCKSILYEQVLEKTIESICRDLPQTVAQLNLPNLEGIKTRFINEIVKKREIINQLPELKKEGILDQQTADLRRYKLETEIAQLQLKIDQLPPGNLNIITQAVTIPQFWLDLSEAERRFYFREFIRKIKIVRPQPQKWEVELVFIF